MVSRCPQVLRQFRLLSPPNATCQALHLEVAITGPILYHGEAPPKGPAPLSSGGGVPSTLFCISQPPADEDYEDYEDYEEAEPKEGEEPTEGAVPVEGAGPADDPAPLSPVSLWDARKRQCRSTHNPAHEVAFLVCFR